MWIFLLVLLFPSPSLASMYDILAGSELSTPQATLERTSWRTGDQAFNVFSSTDRLPRITQPQGSRVWSITDGGRTQLTALDGTILIDGVTSTYRLSGPSFTSSFTDAFIDPRLVGGITSHDWTGSISAAFWTGLPQGNWDLRASTVMPEPSTLALIGPLVVGLWLWKRQSSGATGNRMNPGSASDSKA